jgi:hypothetical protein
MGVVLKTGSTSELAARAEKAAREVYPLAFLMLYEELSAVLKTGLQGKRPSRGVPDSYDEFHQALQGASREKDTVFREVADLRRYFQVRSEQKKLKG